MSDGSESISKDEVEDLLRQAGGEGPPPDAAKPADEPASSESGDSYQLDPSDIEALMKGGSIAGGEDGAATDDAYDDPSQGDIDLLLSQAEAAIASIDQPNDGLPPGVEPFSLRDFTGAPANQEAATIELVRDVQLDLKIELGRTHMRLEDVLRLRRDAIVTLDKLAGDPVDVYVNGRMIARGEVLVLNDNFCVRVTELVVGDSAVA
ncbi:Flagellar motor switch protein FliN [Pseudobythopirellula maris]|uniref:Flagellar motor switch protein FliN n=1 Tax=Pseudobythopirellula maris TaxID=2527991 RepID=A0A5C5ZGG1_9BACT|nr:flagellar motor switch protein FliN [Pseudobythopirellula maris]TWT86509.1 Flagellar motor switch protein FliN [Pseudobythopirellula maris]